MAKASKSVKPAPLKIRDRIVELRRVKASDLIDNPKNWRTHPKEQLAALDGVLKEIGFAGAELAIVTPEGLMLIDGHARKKLAGDEIIPVLVTDLSEAEANLILATFDPIGAMAGADAESLKALLDEVNTGDQNLADMLTKLAEDNGIAVSAAEITEDEIPEPPAVPITQPGDLWILGEHRLLCGDSTKADDVARLMGEAKADCVVTDPPYGGVLNKQHGHGKLKESVARYGGGDWDYRPSKDFFATLLSSSGRAIIWGGNYFASDLPDGRGWLVWDKRNGQSSFADCELAWTNLDAAVRMYSESVQTIASRSHPTQKTVGLAAWCIGMTEGLIYEPFCGSGTTLIAAEQLKRRCFGMEISPAYCDIIVKRWENLTGLNATLSPVA